MQICLPLPSYLIPLVLSSLVLIPTGQASKDADGQEEYYYATNPGSERVKRDTTAARRRGGIRRSPYTSQEKKAVLDLHNQLRARTVNAADMLWMEWNSDLEREAQRWADRCDFNHPTTRRNVGEFNGVGQNLYVSTHEPAAAPDPVQNWFDEISFYRYSTIGSRGSCQAGQMCGHYTQIVWARSYALGCAVSYCDSLTSVSSFNKGYLVVCEYGPAGNVLTRYPYQQGKACSKCPADYKFCVDKLCSLTIRPGGDASNLQPQTTTITIFLGLALVFLGNWRLLLDYI